MNGVIVIDKEKNYTSRDVVNIASKSLKTNKLGHTGTLDPLATGVLVLCVNDATKIVELLTSDDKEYIAEATLGIETDTLDITGEVLGFSSCIIEKERIEEAISKFKGEYMQEVPLYSAVRIDGKRLYDYAFDNQKIKLPSRKVNIKEIELLSYSINNDKTIFRFRCLVSKGTYIRSLIRDIAKELNTIGVMSNLRRCKQGIFSLEDAITLEDLKNGNFKMKSIASVLPNMYKVVADEELIFKLRNGKILDNIYNHDVILFVDNCDNALCIYKPYEKDNTKIKPWKMFLKNNKI